MVIALHDSINNTGITEPHRLDNGDGFALDRAARRLALRFGLHPVTAILVADLAFGEARNG